MNGNKKMAAPACTGTTEKERINFFMDMISQNQKFVKCGCANCGREVSEGEAERYMERHGLDSPPYEEFLYCPYCGGDLIPMEECAVCGNLTDVEDLTCGVCDSCGKDGFTKELGQAYLKDTDQELDFYSWTQGVTVTFSEDASDGIDALLIALFRKAFMDEYRYFEQEITRRMKDWIFDEYDSYCEWLAEDMKKKGLHENERETGVHCARDGHDGGGTGAA